MTQDKNTHVQGVKQAWPSPSMLPIDIRFAGYGFPGSQRSEAAKRTTQNAKPGTCAEGHCVSSLATGTSSFVESVFAALVGWALRCLLRAMGASEHRSSSKLRCMNDLAQRQAPKNPACTRSGSWSGAFLRRIGKDGLKTLMSEVLEKARVSEGVKIPVNSR